jgi:hypothetical protein
MKNYSGKVFYRGQVCNGLYHFSNNRFHPQTLSSICTLFGQWHCQLGHVVPQVVCHVLNSNKLPDNKIKSNSVCPDYQLIKSHTLPFRSSIYVFNAPLDLIFINV